MFDFSMYSTSFFTETLRAAFSTSFFSQKQLAQPYQYVIFFRRNSKRSSMAEIHSHIIVTFHTFESHFLVVPITPDDSETVTFYDNDGDDSVINAKQAPANSTSSTDVQDLNEWNYTRAAAPHRQVP